MHLPISPSIHDGRNTYLAPLVCQALSDSHYCCFLTQSGTVLRAQIGFQILELLLFMSMIPGAYFLIYKMGLIMANRVVEDDEKT